MSDYILLVILGLTYAATAAWSYAAGHHDGMFKAAKQKGRLEVVWAQTGQTWIFDVARDDSRRVVLTPAEGTIWQPANHPHLPS